jgi:hypothetical protein
MLANVLQDHERETRLSLARYARKASKDAEECTVRDAPLVHKVAQTAGIIHSWDANKEQTNILNVALLTGKYQPPRIIREVEGEHDQ